MLRRDYYWAHTEVTITRGFSGFNRHTVTNPHDSDKLQAMVREFSAGGVVVRKKDGDWVVAVIEPAGNPTTVVPAKRVARKRKPVFTLPKGLVDPGEKPVAAALREVHEETGLIAEVVVKLADIKYVYVRSWGDRERVFKVVSFYLMRYQSGRINNVTEEMRVEVAHARWIPLAEAPELLAYKGEKQMARKALEYVEEHSDLERGSS